MTREMMVATFSKMVRENKLSEVFDAIQTACQNYAGDLHQGKHPNDCELSRRILIVSGNAIIGRDRAKYFNV